MKVWKGKFTKNEEIYQNYLIEKYDTNDLFKKSDNESINNLQHHDLTEYKENGEYIKGRYNNK